MRWFDYYATFDESIAMLGDLCTLGFHVIVEPQLADEPKAQTFDRVTDELVAILRRAPSFYLSGAFTTLGVQFDRIKAGDAAGKYMVDQLTLGPILQGMVARINTVERTRRLLPGDISYQDAYRHPETGEWQKASPEVKAAHKQAVATIRKRCVRHQHEPGKVIYIGSEALELLRRGEVQLPEPQFAKGG